MGRPGNANARAILATLAAMALYVVSDVIIKLAGLTLPVTEALAVRAVIGSGMLLAVIAARDAPRGLGPAGTARWVVLRSLLDGALTLAYVTALIGLPLAVITAVTQAAPLLIVALAVPLLGERVGWRRWGAVAVGFAGVLIAARPSLAGVGPGVGLAFAGAVLIALRDLLTRRRLGGVPVLTTALGATLAVGLVAGLAGLLGAGEPWRAPAPGEVALLVLSAAVVAAGNAAIVLAFRDGEVGAVAPFRYAVVPLSVVAGFAAFGEVPDAATLVGAGLVTAGGLYALRSEVAAAGRA